MVDRWAGFATSAAWPNWCGGNLPYCIGGTSTHPRHGCNARMRPVDQVPIGPRRTNARLRDGLQLPTRGRLDRDVHRKSPPCLRVRCRRRCWSLDPQAPHGVAGQYLTPVLGRSIPQRHRTDKAFVAIWCRPGSEIQGEMASAEIPPCRRRLPLVAPNGFAGSAKRHAY